MLKAILAALLLAAALPAAAGPIIVASKIDTEGALLGHLMLLALQAKGLPVTDRLQLGPTGIVRQALLAGEIDLYPEYTGNGAFFFHQEADPVWKDARAGYERVRALDRAANHLSWLHPAPADNSWAIAVNRQLAASLPSPDLAGFARYVAGGGRVRLAASVEFADDPGALPAFEQGYGFHLAGEQLLVLAGGNTTATLRAAAEGISGIDAAMAYSTDGALSALAVTVLADPLHTQPVYAPAPVVREAVLAEYPEIAAALAPVFARLDVGTLRRLNAKIVVEGEDAGAVAQGFLAEAQTR